MRIGIIRVILISFILYTISVGSALTEDVIMTKDQLVVQANGYGNLGGESYLRIGQYDYWGQPDISVYMASDTLSKSKYKWYYNISSANLRLYADNRIGTPGTVNIYRATANWSEYVIKYENQPGISSLIASYDPPMYVWFEVSIKDEIIGVFNGTYSNYGYKFVQSVFQYDVWHTISGWSDSKSRVRLIYTYKNLTNPTNISILSPGNGTQNHNAVNVSWTTSLPVAESEFPITYQFQFSNFSNFSTTTIDTITSNNFSGDVAPYMQHNIPYYARVRPFDGVNYGNWSYLIQFMYNNVSFIFSQKSISESQIYQSSQQTKISVNVTDPDGNISSVLVGVTYQGNETNYSMVQTGNLWEYPFSSSVAGTYTVTNFYATDNGGVSNSSASSLGFTVVPVQGGGGSPGGGAPGSAQTPAATTTIQQQSTVNIKTLPQDPTGQIILQGMVLVGVVLIYLGTRREGALKTIVIGLLMVVGGAATLGWLG